MLVTDEECSELRMGCPVDRGTFQTICDGSRCMAWRWYDPRLHPNGDPILDRRGYCGLAGRIEEDDDE